MSIVKKEMQRKQEGYHIFFFLISMQVHHMMGQVHYSFSLLTSLKDCLHVQIYPEVEINGHCFLLQYSGWQLERFTR